MAYRVLFFCPCSPVPAASGAAHRYLQVLAALRRRGVSTTLISSTLPLDAGWTAAGVAALRDGWVDDVRLYEATPADYLAVARAQRRTHANHEHGHDDQGDDAPWPFAALIPDSLRSWFTAQWRDLRPDLLWLNHIQWHGLIDHGQQGGTRCVVDGHDLVTLNLRMRRVLAPCLTGPPDPEAVCADCVREDFFARRDLTAHPDEYRLYDRFDDTIAISAAEADAIGARTTRTRVHHVPMTYAPRPLENRYAGAALFAVGPHPFNLQGYLYFMKRVMPLVRSADPTFSLVVSGSWFRGMRPVEEPGVTLCGQVADISALYAAARFCISPVLGGTGESVKIVEAMAHGLPVVALSASATGSPVRHGSNGFVATNANDFADYVLRLWSDPALCRQMGQVARQTIAEERSEARLDASLAHLLA